MEHTAFRFVESVQRENKHGDFAVMADLQLAGSGGASNPFSTSAPASSGYQDSLQTQSAAHIAHIASSDILGDSAAVRRRSQWGLEGADKSVTEVLTFDELDRAPVRQPQQTMTAVTEVYAMACEMYGCGTNTGIEHMLIDIDVEHEGWLSHQRDLVRDAVERHQLMQQQQQQQPSSGSYSAPGATALRLDDNSSEQSRSHLQQQQNEDSLALAPSQNSLSVSAGPPLRRSKWNAMTIEEVQYILQDAAKASPAAIDLSSNYLDIQSVASGVSNINNKDNEAPLNRTQTMPQKEDENPRPREALLTPPGSECDQQDTTSGGDVAAAAGAGLELAESHGFSTVQQQEQQERPHAHPHHPSDRRGSSTSATFYQQLSPSIRPLVTIIDLGSRNILSHNSLRAVLDVCVLCFPRLTRLIIGDVGLDEEAIRVLCQAVPSMPRLVSIDLRGNKNLYASSARLLVDLVQKTPRILELRLDNGGGDGGGRGGTNNVPARIMMALQIAIASNAARHCPVGETRRGVKKNCVAPVAVGAEVSFLMHQKSHSNFGSPITGSSSGDQQQAFFGSGGFLPSLPSFSHAEAVGLSGGYEVSRSPSMIPPPSPGGNSSGQQQQRESASDISPSVSMHTDERLVHLVSRIGFSALQLSADVGPDTLTQFAAMLNELPKSISPSPSSSSDQQQQLQQNQQGGDGDDEKYLASYLSRLEQRRVYLLDMATRLEARIESLDPEQSPFAIKDMAERAVLSQLFDRIRALLLPWRISRESVIRHAAVVHREQAERRRKDEPSRRENESAESSSLMMINSSNNINNSDSASAATAAAAGGYRDTLEELDAQRRFQRCDDPEQDFPTANRSLGVSAIREAAKLLNALRNKIIVSVVFNVSLTAKRIVYDSKTTTAAAMAADLGRQATASVRGAAARRRDTVCDLPLTTLQGVASHLEHLEEYLIAKHMHFSRRLVLLHDRMKYLSHEFATMEAECSMRYRGVAPLPGVMLSSSSSSSTPIGSSSSPSATPNQQQQSLADAETSLLLVRRESDVILRAPYTPERNALFQELLSLLPESVAAFLLEQIMSRIVSRWHAMRDVSELSAASDTAAYRKWHLECVADDILEHQQQQDAECFSSHLLDAVGDANGDGEVNLLDVASASEQHMVHGPSGLVPASFADAVLPPPLPTDEKAEERMLHSMSKKHNKHTTTMMMYKESDFFDMLKRCVADEEAIRRTVVAVVCRQVLKQVFDQ